MVKQDVSRAGRARPPLAPITPSVANVTLTSSDSNHSSRKSAALWVKILISAPSPRSDAAQPAGQLQVVEEVSDTARRKLRRSGEQQASTTREMRSICSS